MTGRVVRTDEYATGMGEGWTFIETRRGTASEPSEDAGENVKEGGRDEAIRYEAFTRLDLNGCRTCELRYWENGMDTGSLPQSPLQVLRSHPDLFQRQADFQVAVP